MNRSLRTVAHVFLTIVFVASLAVGWMPAVAGEATPPVVPTAVPTEVPSTDIPSTEVPTEIPTESPTEIPTQAPTAEPTAAPTETPAEIPGTPEATEESSRAALSLLAVDGTLVVTLRDENSLALPDACFTVYQPVGDDLGPAVAGQCDGREDGVADGILTFILPAGDYILILSSAPEGYISGGRTPFSLAEGAQVDLDIAGQPGGVSVLVHAVDPDQNPVLLVCFALHENDGGQVGSFVSANCDAPQGAPGTGFVFYRGIASGDYLLVQTHVPAGFVSTGNTPFSVPAGSTAQVDVFVTNQPAASPGNLVIDKRNENGQPLPGACFSIFIDTGGGIRGDWLLDRCDWEDGNYDGLIAIAGLAPGSYVLSEYIAPEGYAIGYRTTFSISSTQPTVLTVTNTPGGSAVTIRTEDRDTGVLLTGACYGVSVSDGGVPEEGGLFIWWCDEFDGINDGLVHFPAFAAGDYVAEQVERPAGYVVAPDVVFSVDGATASTVVVENVPQSDIDIIIQQLVALLIAILQDILNGL